MWGTGLVRALLAALGARWRSGPLRAPSLWCFLPAFGQFRRAPAGRAVPPFAISDRLSARLISFGATWRSRRDRCPISTKIAPRLDCCTENGQNYCALAPRTTRSVGH